MLNGVRAESTTQEIDDIDVDGSDGGERVEKVESELRACWPFVCGKCLFWWHGRAQLWSCGGRPVAGVMLESRTIGWNMDKFGAENLIYPALVSVNLIYPLHPPH
jgi:hypothetical protein